VLDWKRKIRSNVAGSGADRSRKRVSQNRAVVELDDEDQQDATRKTKLKFSSELEQLSLNHVESTDIL